MEPIGPASLSVRTLYHIRIVYTIVATCQTGKSAGLDSGLFYHIEKALIGHRFYIAYIIVGPDTRQRILVRNGVTNVTRIVTL